MTSVKACLVLGGLLALSDCGSSSTSGTAGHAGATGSAGASGRAGSGTTAGTAGAGGMTMMMPKPKPGMTGTGGAAGAATCTPGVKETIVTGCGYPAAAGSPLATVVFNESEVLRAIEGEGGAPTATVRMFYNDEHALTLGVRSVIVKTAAGMTMTDFEVSPLATNPGSAVNPKTGTNELVGDNSGLDASLRPMWPVLYLTDVTSNPQSRAGDWQQGGRPVNPNAIFGTWKAAVRTVDKTVTPNVVTITPDADPAKNSWNLGTGADPTPAGFKDEGYGAEARWNVPLLAGHSYRLQVIVHDGDQNKVGGDSGEACVLFCAGGTCPTEGCDTHTTGTGGNCGSSDGCPGGTPKCPNGTLVCGAGGVDPSQCPADTICANGCCIPHVG